MDLSLEQLNGYDFDFTINDIVRKDSDRVIESLKLITGNLKTNALHAARINAVPVQDFVVSTEDVVHITGDVRMQQSVSSTGDVVVGGTVNGIHLIHELLTADDTLGNNLKKKFKLKTVPGFFSLLESLVFLDDVFIEDLVVEGSLNDITVNDLLLNVIFDDSVDVTFSRASFDHLTIDGHLQIADNNIGHVDIVNFNSSVVRLDRDETVSGFLKFPKGIFFQIL